jgi:hypothetical protein
MKQVFQGEGATVGDILDVRAATLTVSYEHNGVPLPQGGPQNARIYLHRRDNHLQLIDSVWGPADRIAMEGRFDLFHQYREGAGPSAERLHALRLLEPRPVTAAPSGRDRQGGSNLLYSLSEVSTRAGSGRARCEVATRRNATLSRLREHGRRPGLVP